MKETYHFVAILVSREHKILNFPENDIIQTVSMNSCNRMITRILTNTRFLPDS